VGTALREKLEEDRQASLARWRAIDEAEEVVVGIIISRVLSGTSRL